MSAETRTFHLGNCLDVLRTLPPNSVDSIVTDPPYGLKFMGRKWDYDVPSTEIWAECLRVLKPGGHLLAFAGTRTQHRMAVRIEDAGFEIRDMIAWVYGSGFPKSMDVSKAIDKAAGAEREVVGPNRYAKNHPNPRGKGVGQNYGTDNNPCRPETAPATDAARQWEGWGTALKPALEPITVARKPLIGTVAENVLEYGTGAMNIDGCRVDVNKASDIGRWPANLIHDGSEEVLELFPETTSGGGNGNRQEKGPHMGHVTYGKYKSKHTVNGLPPSQGSAARFFYCAKASKADRGEGNNHPTVKPTALMRYLCRLVTPPGGTVLDPFMGSGSTGKAAMLEGFRFIGIERDAESLHIARTRLEHL